MPSRPVATVPIDLHGYRAQPDGGRLFGEPGRRSWIIDATPSARIERAGHSNRSASVGFTPEARRAGMRAAPNVAAHKINVAAAIVAGSVGLMPYS
jgi:hypothetical protein